LSQPIPRQWDVLSLRRSKIKHGDSWRMKSASHIVDPNQTYESPERPGDRLRPAPDWAFRTLVFKEDLILTSDNGAVMITQDELGNTCDRVGGAFSNYKP
jgi:hypothetical protein